MFTGSIDMLIEAASSIPQGFTHTIWVNSGYFGVLIVSYGRGTQK